MFKMNTLIFTALLLIFNPISGLSASRADYTLKKFTCDTIYTVEHNVYNSKVSYDNDNKVIQYIYTNPVSLTEYYDYNTHNKYYFEGFNCDTEIILGDFPAFYILDTELNDLLSVKTKDNGKVMGIPVTELMDEQEVGRLKLELLLSELRYDNKGVKKNG